MATDSHTPVDTSPYWAESVSMPSFAALDDDLQVDVVVIGGGITGLTAAYLLTAAGRTVAVLERGRCAQVDTGHTSAHLTMVTDVRLSALVRSFGRDHAQAVWDAGLAAIAQIDDTVRAHRIDCGFAWVDGYLHAPSGDPTRRHEAEWREEADLAADLGFDASFVEAVPLADVPGIRIADQARLHPRKYLAGLAQRVVAQGGRIYEQSAADEFRDEPLTVTANGHAVRCQDVVIATHNPIVGLGSALGATLLQTKLALYTSYVVAGRVETGRVPDALFWDTAAPYHYLRLEPHRDHDLVIFGGEDHKTGQVQDTAGCYKRLEETLSSLIPGVEVVHRWSGQVIETPDGLPYIGRVVDHQYAATGFGGNGLTFGTLGAMIASDAVLGRPNPWDALFDPGRTAIGRGVWHYLKENADYPYYRIRDRFAGAESRSLRAPRRGHGKVIDQHGEKMAVYRDPSGAASARSARCPHMGCVVTWNDAERTWDCPCHGSRFTPEGEVISGPAESPLRRIEG
ncbi:MAG: FAD-dependent oxidoreductase [Vicinamibacteria bacterium]|nr:FAD-dependent oxidoreductase [Vicinamibacteria bacterium]